MKLHLENQLNILLKTDDNCKKKSKQLDLKELLLGAGGESTVILSDKNKKEKNDKFKKTRELALMCALDFEAFNITTRLGFKMFCANNGIKIKFAKSKEYCSNWFERCIFVTDNRSHKNFGWCS